MHLTCTKPLFTSLHYMSVPDCPIHVIINLRCWPCSTSSRRGSMRQSLYMATAIQSSWQRPQGLEVS